MGESHIEPPLFSWKGFLYALATVGVATAAAWAVSSLWQRSGEAAYVVPALSLAGVSVLLALWLPALLANVAAGIALFAIPSKHGLHSLVRWTNRQIGHFEALFTWLTFILVVSRGVVFEAAATSALFVLGPMVIDAAGFWASGKRASTRSRLNRARRPFFYVATAVGLGLLALLDPSQAATLLPLDCAVLSGLAIRTVYYFAHDREDEDRPLHRRWREIDRWLIAAAVAAAFFWPLYELKSGFSAQREDRTARDAADRISCDSRAAEFVPEASLFLVSDSQFHALHGDRSGLQLDMVDAVVPVATRPVELDLLSGVTLARFASIYRELLRERPQMLWGHLGDIGDVGCASELDRFARMVDRFGKDRLAALAPGNHDSTFLGNFEWHPHWTEACGRKRSSRALVREFAESHAGRGVQKPPADTGFTAQIVPLGTLRSGRRITGVFLDSNDYSGVSLGIGGSQGSISSAQESWVAAQLDGKNDALVLFMHHTVAQLSRSGKWHLGHLADALGNRLVAIVTAHEHLAANRHPRVGTREIDELVIGSTIDPPQEATLLDFRSGAVDRVELRAQSIPAVPDPTLACPGQPALPAPDLAACRSVLAEVAARCPRVFFRQPRPPVVHPETPQELARRQNQHAAALLECLGVGLPPVVDTLPLSDPAVFDKLETADPVKALCISHVAAVVQGHKSSGWNMESAREMGLVPETMIGSRSIVAPSMAAPSPGRDIDIPVHASTPGGHP